MKQRKGEEKDKVFAELDTIKKERSDLKNENWRINQALE